MFTNKPKNATIIASLYCTSGGFITLSIDSTPIYNATKAKTIPEVKPPKAITASFLSLTDFSVLA